MCLDFEFFLAIRLLSEMGCNELWQCWLLNETDQKWGTDGAIPEMCDWDESLLHKGEFYRYNLKKYKNGIKHCLVTSMSGLT